MRISLLAMLIALVGCKGEVEGEGCLEGADLAPGCGAVVDGKTILLGDTDADVVASFGTAGPSMDLASLGTRFEYADSPLSGLYGDGHVTAIYLRDGFGGKTAGGVGIGSSGSAVTGELGEAVVDAVLGVWWYPDLGIAFTLADDSVERIELFVPTGS